MLHRNNMFRLVRSPFSYRRCQEVYIRNRFSVSGCPLKGTMAKLAGKASSSGERWRVEVLPEHTIFLSHSGHDKPFVERLCEQLKRLNYSPFFDQNSDSLPIGEKFPPHLFKAAEQCLLAVIVLSEGYLTSKWPMLELAAFVKARETKNPKMKLLPLFYKLSPSDLVPGKWIESWKKLAKDGKINAKEIELWSKGIEVLMKAKNVEIERMKSLTEHNEQDEITPDDFSKLLDEVVKDLRPFNGLEFSKYGTSEGRFIQAVVDEICKIIPFMMKYDTVGIHGYQRMCEKTSSLLEEGILTNDGCLYLGLYGMGGVGKTTLCGAMCSFYEAEFRGRVCHVELQGDTDPERIERLKYFLRQLGGFDDSVFKEMNESQGLKLLRNRVKSQPPAFLAVDNVGDSLSSRDEARRFITSLACGSKVIVTSRSRSILESVLGEPKYCKPIPRLEEQEAKDLFLSVAVPKKMVSALQPREDVIVKACIEQCKFCDDGYDKQQYHPLVLRALGTFFHDVDKDDIMKWKKAVLFEKKLEASRELKHVNDILGLNYATLSDEQKMIFLDVVFLFNYGEGIDAPMTRFSRYWRDDKKGPILLIAILHGISTDIAEIKVSELQRKSLVYESSPTLRIHDLYVEFARSMVAMEGSKEKKWWAGDKDVNGYNHALKRLILIEDASKICKTPEELWKCQNMECLIMHNSMVKLEPILDLKCLTNLRVLIIIDFTRRPLFHFETKEDLLQDEIKQHLLRYGIGQDLVHDEPEQDLSPDEIKRLSPDEREELFQDKIEQLLPDETKILCTNGNALHRDSNFYGRKKLKKVYLQELRMVQLFGFDLTRIPFLRDCGNLTFLSIHDCDFDISDSSGDGISLLEKLKAFGDGISLLENLKALETLSLSSRTFRGFSIAVFDIVLQAVVKLKNLKYLEIDLRMSIVMDEDGGSKLDVSRLGALTSLQTLSLPRLPFGIRELIGLDQLSGLVELNLEYSMDLQKLPNLDLLPNLQRICVANCEKLKHPEDQLQRFQELHLGHQCLNTRQ